MDSMLSVQSALGIQTNSRRMPCEPTSVTAILEDTAAPSTDSGVETGAVDLPDSEAGAGRMTAPSDQLSSVAGMSSDNDLTLVTVDSTAGQLVDRPTVYISVVNTPSGGSSAVVCRTVSLCDSRPSSTDLNRRWGSTDLCRSAGTSNNLHSRLAESHASALDRRRWTSDLSLATSARADRRAVPAAAASISGDARVDDQLSFASLSSDSKQDNGCVPVSLLWFEF